MINKYFWFTLIFSSLYLTGCFHQEDLRPERDCPIEELLLSELDYPSNTILNDSRTSIAEYPLESAGGSANYNGSGTSQLVARFFSIENAIKEYEETEKRLLSNRNVPSGWRVPPELEIIKLSANRYKIACGTVTSFGYRCYMVGQYEEYYVFFRSDISGNGINHELFGDLILKIDNEMKSCLEK